MQKKMWETLSKYPDFANSKTVVQEKIEARGHMCMFFPKFHCELNVSERNWCHAKKHSRKYSKIPEALDTCTPELNKKFFRKTSDYLRAYQEGHTCWSVDKAVKQYKSHRRIFSADK